MELIIRGNSLEEIGKQVAELHFLFSGVKETVTAVQNAIIRDVEPDEKPTAKITKKKTKEIATEPSVVEVVSAVAEETPILPNPVKENKEPGVTIDICRAKLKEVFNKKGQAKAMEILKKFGNVRSITEVPPSSYVKFKQVCEMELGNNRA